MRIVANASRLESWAGRLDAPLDDLRAAIADYHRALRQHQDAPNDLPTAVEDLAPRADRALDDGGVLADLARGFADALRQVDQAVGLDRADVPGGTWQELLAAARREARAARLTVDVLQDLGVPSSSPDAARRHLTDHPELVAELLDGDHPLPSALDAYVDLQLRTTPADGRLFADLDPATQELLGILVPRLADDDRAPFASRIGANHLLVVRAADRIDDQLARVEAEDERRHHDWVPFNEDDLDGRIAELQKRAALYDTILDDNRQLLLFDEAGDGRIVELHGTIGTGTDHVGVLVPGTGATLGGHEVTAKRARTFVQTASDVAMISWLGGDMPDDVTRDAPFNHYAEDNGPVLSDFSLAVRREVDATAAGADLTVIGHSYGGATVGQAELAGLDADRILHVSSAGAGAGVDEPGDYPVADRDRYALTDDDDPIQHTQGIGVGRLGHGADPDRLFVELATGNYADGTEIDEDAHSRVFTEDSDAWKNMVQVVTGGTVDVRVPPDVDVYTGPYGGAAVIETPNDPEPLDID